MREFNSLDKFWTCKPEYFRKAREVIIKLVFLLLATLGLALLITIILYLSTENLEKSLFEQFIISVSLLYNFSSENDPTLIPIAVLFLLRIIGVFLLFVVAALIANILSQSVNPICISQYYVINSDAETIVDSNGKRTKQNKPDLEVRYWIRLPNTEYLYDARCTLEITSIVRSTIGGGNSRQLFRTSEQYAMIRGVRFFSVPVDDPCFMDALEEVISPTSEAQKLERCYLKFSVSGELANGQRVFRTLSLKPKNLFNGFNFLSIRHTTCMDCSLESIGYEKIYFNHFGKLVRCKNGELNEEWLCSPCDPNRDVVVDDHAVVPDWYDRFRNFIRKYDFKFHNFGKSGS